MPGVELLEDFTWDSARRSWVLRLRLAADVAAEGGIATRTEWYAHLSPAYPWGQIDFYPAKAGGLTQTFPHQLYNGLGPADRSWRDGLICVRTGLRAIDRRAYDVEPHDAHGRLRWNIERALAWLADAWRGQLVAEGDPFELPALPSSALRECLVFSESAGSSSTWQEIRHQSGLVDMVRLGTSKERLLVAAFRSFAGDRLVVPTWGEHLRAALHGEVMVGGWIRVTSAPMLPPYEVPTSWEGLRAACRAQEIALDELLGRVATSFRDGQSHVLLLGFPIPARIGEPPRQLHWQALRLPVLSHGRQVPAGFRANERGYWQRDLTQVLRGGPLAWMNSENWHKDEVTTRGRLPERLESSSVMLIGGGALGSAVAEILVRGGVNRLLIVDYDTLKVGNLVRHTLGLGDIDRSKAEALAERLNRASPHASVRAMNAKFPPTDDNGVAELRGCDLVIDCTASDEVLYHLEQFDWGGVKTFFSISLGLDAARLFCFTATGLRFPQAAFRQLVQPWLEREIQEHAGQELPREGIGCWHPVFPARVDDVWMMASVAIKDLEHSVASGAPAAGLRVYGHEQEMGQFRGLRLLEESRCAAD